MDRREHQVEQGLPQGEHHDQAAQDMDPFDRMLASAMSGLARPTGAEDRGGAGLEDFYTPKPYRDDPPLGEIRARHGAGTPGPLMYVDRGSEGLHANIWGQNNMEVARVYCSDMERGQADIQMVLASREMKDFLTNIHLLDHPDAGEFNPLMQAGKSYPTLLNEIQRHARAILARMDPLPEDSFNGPKAETLHEAYTLSGMSNPESRVDAAKMAAKAGKIALPLLETLAKDDHRWVRMAAVERLPKMGKAAVLALDAATQDRDGGVRLTALFALDELGAADAAARRMDQSPRPEVRGTAQEFRKERREDLED